jgi:hypothetical protein
MARPSEYDPSVLDVAEDYINNFKDKYEDAIPSAAGLACVLGISKSTLYLWKDAHPELSDTLSRLQSSQERQAINNGITGVFNPTITKLVLANHGYHDKVDQELTGANGGAVKVEGWVLEGVKPNDSKG